MSFRWRYLDASGSERSGPDEAFDDQAEAESWLTDEFATLLDSGVDSVTLLDGDTEVYTMSLQEA